MAVINADDPYASRLEGLAQRTLTYGLKGVSGNHDEKIRAEISAGLNSQRRRPPAKSKCARRSWDESMSTTFSRRSARASRLKSPTTKSKRVSRILELVPGRFQRIDEGQPFLVVVDYAHTDDALRNLISTARELSSSGRIITYLARAANAIAPSAR